MIRWWKWCGKKLKWGERKEPVATRAKHAPDLPHFVELKEFPITSGGIIKLGNYKIA